MALHPQVQAQIDERWGSPDDSQSSPVKRGYDIFSGTDYPMVFGEVIGQLEAVARLKAAIATTRARNVRLDHTMLASGTAGIGKTTLAQITAFELGVGLVTVSGPVGVADARRLMRRMQDKDVLFWDEIHMAVAGGKTKAEWLLPLLTDGKLVTRTGTELMPDITVIGATTDVGRLPATIQSRFMVWPEFRYYTDIEATLLVQSLVGRMGVDLGPDYYGRVAAAADHNPRAMRRILTAIRDVMNVGEIDLDMAFRWAGVTYDGLTQVCQNILLALLSAKDYTASADTLAGILGEPGPMRYAENQLIQRGLLTISGRGRVLTDTGVERAAALVAEARGR